MVGSPTTSCHTISMLATDAQRQQLLELFHKGTKLRYDKGEFIIRSGETPSGVFYIEEGLVKAYDITKYGEENLLIIRKPREIFPLIWGVTGTERHVVYQTLAPTTVWRISRKSLEEYIHTPGCSLSPLLDMTVEMYRIHSERIINLEYRTVRERLISFLLTMAGRFGQECADGICINVPLRQQDIASSINSSRETTSREISALEKRKLIANSPQGIVLRDLEKLQSFLQVS
ncbi:Crp/Fnr family transcriptional regulator [Patescibacteria group bacterium]|nr:MAG: Crp/Fnr family transcriptional regulator [Patescibacteria group bacterium]